jgi:hypothetical protein
MATRLPGIFDWSYWTYRQPVLPNYRAPRTRLEALLKKGSFYVFCVFLGLFYGLAFTVLPPQLALYLAGPVLVLALLVIWVLPDVGRGPVGLLSGLFFTYLLVLPLWPNYLALQLPGLPWISFRRLVVFPMALILLICLSVSTSFREALKDVLRANKPLTYMIAGFAFIQLLTVPVSKYPFFSLNVTVNDYFGITAAFFIAAWACADDRKRNRVISFSLWAAGILCVIGLLEERNGGILWAGYIPSFLAVQDESVSRTLTAIVRDGGYRVTTTFSTSLSMAEYLAVVVPFVIHRLINSVRIERIAFWAGFDLLLLVAIASTQSRLGILGWIVAHGFYGCIWAFRRWKQMKADLIGPAVSLVYSGAFAFIIVGMFTIPSIRNRTIGGGSSGFSDQSRREQFELMWPKVLQNPFGYGPGRSGEVLGFFTPGGQLTVDSHLITLLLDFGILGAALYFGALIYCIYHLTRIAFRTGDEIGNFALPLATALVVVLETKFVLSQADNHPLVAILQGMSAALIWAYRKRLEPERGVAAQPFSGPFATGAT